MNTLTAPSGKHITQAADIPISERIMATSVCGFGDLEAIYRIATDEEYAEWLTLQETPPDELD